MPPDAYHRSLTHQGLTLSLEIIRTRRKSLAIHVFPGERVTEVRVPLKCPWTEVDAFIKSRLDWLVAALQKLAAEPIEPKFRRGDVHTFLGKGYVLETSFGRNNVVMTPDQLWISCKRPDSELHVAQLFFDYLRRESETIFQERMTHCVTTFPEPVAPTGLRVRRMKARWGSCSEKGEICLNTLLVQKKSEVIDMVITHELCHLVHFQHDRRFYQLMDLAMPDWRERETGLASKIDPDPPAKDPTKDPAHPEQLSLL